MVGGDHIVRRGWSRTAFGIALLLALGGSLALAAWAPAQAAAVTIDSPEDGSYIKNRTPTFSGTGLPFIPLTLSIREAGGESAAEPVTATPGPAGQWEATPEVSLSDGSYTAAAEQPEALEPKSEVAFIIDNVAPSVTMAAPKASTNVASPTLKGTRGTAKGDSEVVTVTIRDREGHLAAEGTAIVEGSTWSYSPPSLSDGTYTAVATQVDQAGNVGESEPARGFTVDTIKPLVTLSAPPPASVSKDTAPTLTGTGGELPGDEPTVRVTIYKGTTVGGQEAASGTPTLLGGTWTYTPNALPDGTYTAQALQSDEAGNVGESSAYTFTIDTQPPSLSMDPVLSPRNTSPALEGARGSAEGDAPVVTVELFEGSSAEGKLLLTESAAVGLSTWSYTGLHLSGGTYTARASQKDWAENVATATRTFTIDTTPPAVSLSTPAEGAFLSTAQPTFTGGAGNASGDSQTVTVSIFTGSSATGAPVTKSVTRSGASWSWAPGAAELELKDGTYTVEASQTDSAGNSATSAPHTFAVKTSGPSVSLDPVAPLTRSAPTFTGASGTEFGDEQTITVEIYAGATVSPPAQRTLNVTASEGRWSAGPVEGLSDGTYTVQAEQKDKAGNTGRSAPATFTIDTTKPKISVDAVASPTKDPTPTLEGNRGTEPGDQAAISVTIHEGASIEGKTVSSQSFGVHGSSWSYTTPQLADGTYTAQVTQEDDATNVGQATVTFTVDTTPPHVTLLPIPPLSNDSTPTLEGAAGKETGDLPSVKVTIYEGSTGSGHEAASAAVPVSAGKWTYTAPQLNDGTYTALVTQSDKAGNAGVGGPATFAINTAPPTVTLSSPALASNNTTPSFSGTATDTTPVTVKIFPRSATSGPTVWEASAAVAGERYGPVTVSPPLADGQYTAMATQPSSLKNPEGKSAAVTFTVNTKAPSVVLNQPTSPSNNTTPTFTGTGSDPSGAVTVKVYEGKRPEGAVVSEATANGTGASWSSTPASPALKKEKHLYTAIATQKSSLGNPDGISAPVTFTVDTNPPTVTLNQPKSPSNNATPSFTGTASDTSAITVEIHEGSIAGKVVATATAAGTGAAWTSGGANNTLKSGQYSAIAKQPSSIGNPQGASAPVNFLVDTNPPAVTLATPHSPTNNSKVTFTGSAGTEPGDAEVVGLTIYRGTTPGGEVVLTGNATRTGHSWSYTSSSLEDGTYTARASQKDWAENVGFSAPASFTVDTTPPTVVLNAPPKKSNNRAPAFTGTASEKTPVTVRIYEGETSMTPIREVTASGTAGEWKSPPISPELPVKKALYTATATQTDEAGNTTTTARVSFIVDGEAPTVTLNPPRTPSNESRPTFTGTASDTTPVTVLIYAGTSASGTPASKATAPGNGGVWRTGPANPALPDGRYMAVAVQQSAVGNHEGQTPPVSFAVDTVAPVVTVTSPPSGSSFSGDALQAEGGADVGQGALPGVTLQVFSGGSIAPEQAPAESVVVNSVAGRWSASVAGLAAGTYTLRALQSDEAGNIGVSAPSAVTRIAPPTSAPPRPAPGASFTWFPPVPHVGERFSLVSNSSDQGSPITSYGWDLAGNGPFQAGGQVLTTRFSTAGNHVVRLRVADAVGLTSVRVQTIPVTAHKVHLMQPFPTVRVVTSRTSSGARLRLLSVLAPVGARISVSCRGHGCPARSLSRTASAGRAGAASVEFRRFERLLRAGLILEIRVYRSGVVGKYTKLTIRRGGPPRRLDTCLSPTGVSPMPCPTS